MVKHKQRGALFDLLRKERPSEKPPEAIKPQAPVRPVTTPAAAPVVSAPPPRLPGSNMGPMTQIVTPRSIMVTNQVTLSYGMLAVVGVGVVCLCVLCFVLGLRLAPSGPALPAVDPGKSFPEVQKGPVMPGIVQPPAPTKGTPPGAGPYPGPVSTTTDGPDVVAVAPPPVVTDTHMPPTSGEYHVQIQQVANDTVLDKLRGYLATNGVETEYEKSGGSYLLFSKQHVDAPKAKEQAAAINKLLKAFTEETRIPTRADAYSVKVK
jgi:hypothetical protein